MSDEYIRLVVERFRLNDDGCVEDVIAVKSENLNTRTMTGWTDDELVVYVWSLITQSAFEMDEAERDGWERA